MSRQGRKMRKLPRSLHFYVAASTFYAALVFFVVQYIYTIQLAESGLIVARHDTEDILASIQLVSFVVWLGISLIAAVVMHRLARALASARSAEEHRQQELGSIFGLSAALAGPLDLEDIGRQFLGAVRNALDASVTVALIVYDDVLEAFRTVGAEGPDADQLRGEAYSAVTLAAAIRTRVIDHRQPLLVPDTAANPETWTKLSQEMPQVARAASFAALPLVSRDRLVGALLLMSDRARALIADRVQMPMIMGQYVAGSIHSALSVSEAEARAEREALVNRVAQRARASLDPDEILRGTVDELGRVLGVSRAIVSSGVSEDDLNVSYEWAAPGVIPVGRGARSIPVAQFAARLGRTVVVTDIRHDRRFAEPATKDPRQRGGVAVAATPIRVGGQLKGALALSQIDRPREWSANDVRLIEAVADELRVAITSAEAFEQQRRAVAELERLNRAKSDFVSIVSHEFRTPLTGIQGFSEMMTNEDLTLAEMREYAGDKMESGRMQLHHEPVDLNTVAAESADRVRPNAPAHPVTLRLDPALGTIMGDRDKLTQVLANLLNNAVKYSPNGGEIVVSTRVEGAAAHLVVRDHGMGIPNEALETIFERYGRVESRATRYIRGTGLGLPIVRQIVQLHGGTVWAESTVGEGSLFHVTLPLAAAAELSGVAGAAPPRVS